MKVITIGNMPQEKVRAGAIVVARGQYKPKPGDPKIWFPSMKSAPTGAAFGRGAGLIRLGPSSPVLVSV